jgi:hypothetical protein
LAEELFQELPKTDETYSALICGICKFTQETSPQLRMAKQLYDVRKLVFQVFSPNAKSNFMSLKTPNLAIKMHFPMYGPKTIKRNAIFQFKYFNFFKQLNYYTY